MRKIYTAPTVDDADELPGALLGGLKGREVHLSHLVGPLRRRHEHRTPCPRELAALGLAARRQQQARVRHRTAHAAGRAQVTALVAAHRPDLAVPPRPVFGGALRRTCLVAVGSSRGDDDRRTAADLATWVAIHPPRTPIPA